MDHIVMHISESGQINFTTPEGDPVNVRVSKVKSLNPWGDGAQEQRVKPGDKVPDGSVYVGLSPDTGRPLYTTCEDQGAYDWAEVSYVAKDLRDHGHKDWRLPSMAELELLYKKRDMGVLDGSFDIEGGYYWSCDEDLNFLTKVKRFSDGVRGHSFKKMERHLRCVRSDESVDVKRNYERSIDLNNYNRATIEQVAEKAAAQAVPDKEKEVKSTPAEATPDKQPADSAELPQKETAEMA